MDALVSKRNPEEPSNSDTPLYADRVKIHPRSVTGFYRRLKTSLMWAFLLIYHFSPWLPWDRGPGKPNQAILFDISGKKIYLLDLEIWPQDIYILTGIMIFAAVGLFLAASLFGRAWCGFACFQTVWTDLFMKVESWIEGDRNARMRLDKAPNSVGKLLKRSAKHVAWLGISAFFALSFMWYFGDAKTVTIDIFTLNVGGWSLATFSTLMAMTYVMAGFAREQVCFYMCPYGRFQGVMMDDHSKVISYESWRGETRGKIGKDKDFTDRGHCIDCTLCVQVCPTGIDIREGQQMECIGCGLCVDACNTVMDKFDLPRNLISYDSNANIALREKTRTYAKGENNFFRSRTLIYATILLATVFGSAWGFTNRAETELTILKDRSPFFVRLSSGQIQNAYTLRILNKSLEDKSYAIDVEALNLPDFHIVGNAAKEVQLAAGSVATLRLIVKGKIPEVDTGTIPISVIIRDMAEDSVTIEESIFSLPG
jgi:cytochrome c oxidase accessory protein FixG